MPRGNDLGFSASQRVVIEANVVCTFSMFGQVSRSISAVEIIKRFCKNRLHCKRLR